MQAVIPLPAHVLDEASVRRLLAAVKLQFTVALSFDGDGEGGNGDGEGGDGGSAAPLPQLLVRLGYEMSEYSTTCGLDSGQVASARKRYGRNELGHYEVGWVGGPCRSRVTTCTSVR